MFTSVLVGDGLLINVKHKSNLHN